MRQYFDKGTIVVGNARPVSISSLVASISFRSSSVYPSTHSFIFLASTHAEFLSENLASSLKNSPEGNCMGPRLFEADFHPPWETHQCPYHNHPYLPTADPHPQLDPLPSSLQNLHLTPHRQDKSPSFCPAWPF